MCPVIYGQQLVVTYSISIEQDSGFDRSFSHSDWVVFDSRVNNHYSGDEVSTGILFCQ